MTDPLKRARDLRIASGDTSPGFGLKIDETWEWPLSENADGSFRVDSSFFDRVFAQTGQQLTVQQAIGVLEIWYTEVLRPRGFSCPVMERHLMEREQ